MSKLLVASALSLLACGDSGGPSQSDRQPGEGIPVSPSASGAGAPGLDVDLVDTGDGFALQTSTDAVRNPRRCGASCEDVCFGCLRELCVEAGLSGCSSRALSCLDACGACVGAAAGAEGETAPACGARVCRGKNPECYIREVGLRDFVRPQATPSPSEASPPSPSPGSNPDPSPNAQQSPGNDDPLRR